jgi:hypothetical protein
MPTAARRVETDRLTQTFAPPALDSSNVCTRTLQDPPVDGRDQPRLLHQRDEGGRQEHATLRMAPAHERPELHRAVGAPGQASGW